MTKTYCDWCLGEFTRDKISTLTLENDCNNPLTLHICHECGVKQLPKRAHAVLSWTSP